MKSFKGKGSAFFKIRWAVYMWKRFFTCQKSVPNECLWQKEKFAATYVRRLSFWNRRHFLLKNVSWVYMY